MKGNVLVIGLGLIGGSISLAIKKQHQCHIIGYDLNEERSGLALSLGVVDEYITTLEKGVERVDLIIIAVPVTETIRVLNELSSMYMKEGTLITDVGSTKDEIVNTAYKVLPDYVEFIGGHPMAGSHKSGVEAAKEDLFENAFYVITPVEHTNEKSVSSLKNWLSGTQSTFVSMSPEEHDHVAGVVSHFPHIIASSLVQHAEYFHQESPIIQDLAAGGFKDITRIASANPKMWTDILLHNRGPILRQFDIWTKQMNNIRKSIESSSKENIHYFFDHAKEFRDEFSTHKRGALETYYDLFVDIPDSLGVLAEVTSLLAKNQINITNIEILDSREDTYGVLRISFPNDNTRIHADTLISPLYETFIIS